jgi:hypothetical protein
VIAAPSATAATESVPVGNGDFEQPVVASVGRAFTTFTSPSGFVGTNGVGWLVTGGNVDLVNSFLWSDASASGSGQSVDLNGDSPGTICQAVPTGAGFDYVVDFEMSRNGDGGSTSASLTLTASDSQGSLGSESFSHSGAWSSAAPDFQTNSLAFAAREASTTLCFASNDSGPFGPVVDNVSVTKLNEAPIVTISNPSDGEKFYQGQQTTFDFSCSDPDGDELTCDAEIDGESAVDPGDPIPTGAADLGNHEITVTADDGEDTVSVTHTYQVLKTGAACRATTAQLLGLKLGDANPAFFPCATKSASLLDTSKVIGPTSPLSILNSTLVLKAVQSDTVRTPGSAVATSSIADARVRVPLLNLDIRATALQSTASSAVPDNCAQVNAPTSSVGSITVNGKATPVGNASTKIDLPAGLGVIWANQVVNNPDGTVTVRALVIDLPGTALDIVLAESRAGIGCLPAPLPLPVD